MRSGLAVVVDNQPCEVTEEAILRDLVALETRAAESLQQVAQQATERAQLLVQLAQMRGAVGRRDAPIDRVKLMPPAEALGLSGLKRASFWREMHAAGLVVTLSARRRAIRRQRFLSWMRTR